MSKVEGLKQEVKGLLFIDWFKMIKKLLIEQPEIKDQLILYLTVEEIQGLSGMILPTSRYPYSFFRGLGRAVFHLVAHQDLKLVRQTGKALMEVQLQEYGKILLIPNHPLASLKTFVYHHARCFFNVATKTSLELVTPKSVKICLTLEEKDKRDEGSASAYAEQLAGSCEELAAQAGGKNVQLTVAKTKSGDYEFSLNWE